ncbi:ABC transporter ATP-binding protein [Rhodococcus sp. 06-156-3C]|uniref:ABC transporter ATP-binding protein n=1 Tax=Nocardiaceae TaxID=85025 RepID=UPI0005230ECB|nr:MULTISPECIES: ATP-binding cassette domain-containing protein [Rhodococcus]OZD11020.1 ABC transporter ATP-binding protein [Rhodococcus sp. 06-156-4C]OZD14435.1 ABC transporter ATP-binding protein [Rhodococcus sp. 06-156-4a]OZD24769.1 ABC transporter ATP-binding protein [Rhodococcus sp. 06-156-3C]OZD27743.1 ABC transporter ATP-binding protein [Rhodococcus sp. 06-156-3b]OZD39724.1 ABC transporter ATP-binding protein [Rhodococcus sp. 06-156-3]
MSAPQLVVDAVTKKYGPARGPSAVSNVSLTVEPGELLGIVGESGSGKSTLGKMLAGLETPTSGEITWDGSNLKQALASRSGRTRYRRVVQLIAQDTTSSFDPRHTIRESLRVPAQVLGGLDRKAADAAVDRIVVQMGLPVETADRTASRLSGGQRQRMAIARALIVSPQMLICDEVVSALDVSVQGSVLNLLKRYCRETGAGLVFISHGLPATAFITDTLAVMSAGKIVECGSTATVLAEPAHPYTNELVHAYSAGTVPALS